MANPNPTYKFPKNNNANPNGAPKKELAMTGALREILLEKNPDTKIERYKELLRKALSMAMRGDGDMLKYLINRIEGMPKGSEKETNINILNVIPVKDRIYGGESVSGILRHDSDQEDIQPKEEN